jgi:hypothetical protein
MAKALLFVLLISTTCFSQIRISIQPEFGINSFGFDKITKTSTSEKHFSRISSPLVGLWSTTYVDGYTFVSLGVQYTETGQLKTFNYQLVDPATGMVSYKHEELEDFSFSKFSVPVSVGYSFVARKLVISPSLGAKAVFYVDGSYHHHLKVTQGDRYLIGNMFAIDPYYRYGVTQAAQRRNVDVFLNLEMRFFKNVSLNFAYSASLRPQEFRGRYPMFDGMQPSLEQYTPRDLSLSLKYLFTLGKK